MELPGDVGLKEIKMHEDTIDLLHNKTQSSMFSIVSPHTGSQETAMDAAKVVLCDVKEAGNAADL